MRSHTPMSATCVAVLLLSVVSVTTPAAAAGTVRSGHVAHAVERPPASPVSWSSGPRFITSFDGCCVKVRGVDGGRFLRGL